MRYLKVAPFLLSIAFCWPGNSLAQGADKYPSKPVMVIVPFAPGGSAEQEARLYTTKISTLMPQPFILDFKPGKATILGANYVAKAPSDGLHYWW